VSLVAFKEPFGCLQPVIDNASVVIFNRVNDGCLKLLATSVSPELVEGLTK